MPTILTEENTRNMSDNEILTHVLKEYACESSYRSYEKDYGGAIVDRKPFVLRDKGQYARTALNIIENRKSNVVYTQNIGYGGGFNDNKNAWLWALLFGCLYFFYKGAWLAGILSFVLAFMTAGISHLIFPFFARSIVNKNPRRYS